MKKDFLNAALGSIDEAYINEAADITSKKHISLKKLPMLAAAVLCFAILTVGAAALGIRYFVPGIGILDDGSMSVYISEGEIKLGEGTIDAIMVTDFGDHKEANIWVWRPASMGITGTVDGRVPAELDNVYVVASDGSLIEHRGGSMATAGFSCYYYPDVPSSESIIIRDNSGNEVTVPLTDLNKSEYAGVDGIRIGEDKTFAAIPVADSANLIAAEFYDPLTVELASGAASVSAHCIAATVTETDEYGMIAGSIILKGVDNNRNSNGVMDVGSKCYNKGITKLMPKSINLNFHYDITSDVPEVTFPLPEVGETIEVDLTVYDSEYFTLKVTSVTNSEEGLQYTYDIQNHIDDPTFHISFFDVDDYIYGAVDYMNGQTHIKNDHARINVFNMNMDHERGTFITDHSDPDFPAVPIEPGTEITISLMMMTCEYYPENYNFQDPMSNLGVIDFTK
ncbi:MAG: hypothetical protein J6I45_04470 [Clostridia bacterium]|nr:hypothetical protein [Clostridia bacterium]